MRRGRIIPRAKTALFALSGKGNKGTTRGFEVGHTSLRIETDALIPLSFPPRSGKRLHEFLEWALDTECLARPAPLALGSRIRATS